MEVFLMQNTITQKTVVSIGLAGTMLFAAFSFGVMYNRFTTLEYKVSVVDTRIEKVEAKLSQFQTDFNRIYYPEKIRPSEERITQK